jgi:hypothetical protein
MRHVATLGNESHIVAIGTYCHDLTLIATNTVVAIDPISCSALNQPFFALGFNSKPPHIKYILLYQLSQKFRDQKNSKRKR